MGRRRNRVSLSVGSMTTIWPFSTMKPLNLPVNIGLAEEDLEGRFLASDHGAEDQDGAGGEDRGDQQAAGPGAETGGA